MDLGFWKKGAFRLAPRANRMWQALLSQDWALSWHSRWEQKGQSSLCHLCWGRGAGQLTSSRMGSHRQQDWKWNLWMWPHYRPPWILPCLRVLGVQSWVLSCAFIFQRCQWELKWVSVSQDAVFIYHLVYFKLCSPFFSHNLGLRTRSHFIPF